MNQLDSANRSRHVRKYLWLFISEWSGNLSPTPCYNARPVPFKVGCLSRRKIACVWTFMPDLKGSSVLTKKAWCRSSGMDVSYSRRRSRSSPYTFFSLTDVWSNFWPLRKDKESHMRSSRIFIPEKGTFESFIQDGAIENFKIMFFGIWQTVAHLTGRKSQYSPLW